jgi:predicted aldo/keto reductase-like oxidoreductase
MGMSCHRGIHPGRPRLIRLLRQAVDRGVTFFDTTETYGSTSSNRARSSASAGLEKKLRTVEFPLSGDEVRELEDSFSRITIVGARYPAAEQQRSSR